MLHFSTCLTRNDLCTAEPQTIIYSSPHRPAVHEAKVKVLLRDDPTKSLPPIQTTFPPSKRSLAPINEVQEFVNRFRTYHKSEAIVQPVNPNPKRPDSSSSQNKDDDDRLVRTSYNVYLHAPRPLIQRGRGDILQQLKLHVYIPIVSTHVCSIKHSCPLLMVFFSIRTMYYLLHMPMNSIKSPSSVLLKSRSHSPQTRTSQSSVIKEKILSDEDIWTLLKR